MGNPLKPRKYAGFCEFPLDFESDGDALINERA